MIESEIESRDKQEQKLMAWKLHKISLIFLVKRTNILKEKAFGLKGKCSKAQQRAARGECRVSGVRCQAKQCKYSNYNVLTACFLAYPDKAARQQSIRSRKFRSPVHTSHKTHSSTKGS
jgi:hypothetical protein